MKTYLVTGAAGFIASRVCEMLLAAGHRVVGVDNLNDYYDVRLKLHRLAGLLGRREPIANCEAVRTGSNAQGSFLFFAEDIENTDATLRLFADHQFDAVFNLAARAGVRYSMENPHVYLATNALGTLNLLDGMKRYGVKKMVLASTSSLYAGSPSPWSEDLPVNTPLSPYAASKKAAEMMAYSYMKLFGISTSVVRYFTVYGPRGRPDMSIFRFIKWIDERRPVILYGDGSQSRDFTYIDDIARGSICALASDGFEVFNLGGGRSPLTLLQIIATIERVLGKTAILEQRPFHAADLQESHANIAKARRELGWEPTVEVDDGLKRSIQWYLSNKNWLAEINCN